MQQTYRLFSTNFRCRLVLHLPIVTRTVAGQQFRMEHPDQVFQQVIGMQRKFLIIRDKSRIAGINPAVLKGIDHIVTGVSQTDFSGYPDCRDAFIKSLNVTLNLAMDGQFVLHTPLMWIDKAETWALADELGVLDLIRHETLTCYNGIPGDGCGHCPACKLRREGLEKYLAGKRQPLLIPGK